jgi:hypothetical protein
VSTPTARVPVIETTIRAVLTSGSPRDASSGRFVAVCKLFLRKSFDDHEATLQQWQERHLGEVSDQEFAEFVEELERSAVGTPKGRQRRAASAKNGDLAKLLLFLDRLMKKHRGR